MRTIFVLEAKDMALLGKGLPFPILLPNGQNFVLQADRNGHVADNGGERRPRRRYTDVEKAEILREADTIGVKATARKYDLDDSAIYRWKGQAEPAATNGHKVDRASAFLPLRKGQRRAFTDEQKKAVVKDAEKIGFTATLKKYGISSGVLSSWRGRRKK